MKVLTGWSGQDEAGSWHRLDVELDETDVLRLTTTHGLVEMTVPQVFLLLSAEAEYLLSVGKKHRNIPVDVAQAKANLDSVIRVVQAVTP